MRGFFELRLALILLLDAIYHFRMVDSAMMAACEFLSSGALQRSAEDDEEAQSSAAGT